MQAVALEHLTPAEVMGRSPLGTLVPAGLTSVQACCALSSAGSLRGSACGGQRDVTGCPGSTQLQTSLLWGAATTAFQPDLLA